MTEFHLYLPQMRMTFDTITDRAGAAEAAGFDSVWTVEHIVYPEGYESAYPYASNGKMPGSGDSPIPDPLCGSLSSARPPPT